MCFYNDDYDWTASVSEVTDLVSGHASRCCECGCGIEPGQWRRHIWQQQYEECQVCEYGEADEACVKHDYGETYATDVCRECTWLLAAIEAVEADEGCPEYARQPPSGELAEHMRNPDSRRYWDRALEMHPQLAGGVQSEWFRSG
ncbi:MAG: hypothetical protein ACPGVG_12680 [Mycobacterium sp.]